MIAAQGIYATHRLIESESLCEREKRVNNIAQVKTRLSAMRIIRNPISAFRILTCYSLIAICLCVLSAMGSCQKPNTTAKTPQKGKTSSTQSISFNWPMAGHDAKHTKLSPFVGPKSSKLAWKYDLDENSHEVFPDIHGEPVIADGAYVYVLRLDGTLYKISRGGNLEWKNKIGNLAPTTPCIGQDGTLYVSALISPPPLTIINQTKQALYAVSPDGATKWSVALGIGLAPLSPVISDKGVIYTGIFQGDLVAVSSSGKRIWKKSIGGGVMFPPAITDDGGLIVVTIDKTVKALDTSGQVLWSYQPDDKTSSPPVIGDDGTIYVCADGKLLALNAVGKLKWSYAKDLYINAPAMSPDGSLLVSTHKGSIVKLTSEGKVKWELKLEGKDLGTPCVDANGTVYVPTGFVEKRGALFAVSAEGKLLWKTDIGTTYITAPSPVIGDDGRLYVGDKDGVLWAFGE
jgi:outer membrane protein assembly factor BamB